MKRLLIILLMLVALPGVAFGDSFGDFSQGNKFKDIKIPNTGLSSTAQPNTLRANGGNLYWGGDSFWESLGSPDGVISVATGGGDFTSIQAAINAADTSGGKKVVVIIYPGVYTENVVMKSGVNLFGHTGGSGVDITSSSGTTLAMGSGYCHATNLRIITTGTAGTDRAITATGGLHLLTSVKAMADVTNGWPSLIELTDAALYLRNGCNMDYDHTGTGGGRISAFILNGASTLYSTGTNTNMKYAGATASDEIIIIEDKRTGGTLVISGGNSYATLTTNASEGEVEFIEVSGTNLTPRISNHSMALIGSNNINHGDIYRVKGTGNHVDSRNNNLTIAGFASNRFTNVDASGEVDSRGDALEIAGITKVSDAIFGAGSTSFVSYPAPGDIQLSGIVVPNTIDVTAAYGAGETWLFDIMQCDGTFNVTFPADITPFPDGAYREIWNVGSGIIIIDPNGNPVDGDTSLRNLRAGGYVRLKKLDGEIRVISSSLFGIAVAPDDVANLEIWIDGETGVSVTGALIDSILSQDATGTRTCTSSGGDRPTLVTAGLNSLDTMLFDGSTELSFGDVEVHSNTASRGLHVFAVTRPEANNDTIVGKYQNGNTEWYHQSSRSRVWETGTGGGRQTASVTPDMDTWQIQEMSWIPGGYVKAYINGILITESSGIVTDIADTTSDLMIGDVQSAGNFLGSIAEIIVYSRQISNGERTGIINYLTARWDLSDVPIAEAPSYWDRDADTATLTPDFENDNVDLGAGESTAYTVTATNYMGLPPLASAPTAPTAGTMYHNTSDNNTYVWDGSAWDQINN